MVRKILTDTLYLFAFLTLLAFLMGWLQVRCDKQGRVDICYATMTFIPEGD